MRTQASHLLHAARVAAVATLIVMSCYVMAVVLLNVFVVHRLTSQADAHLSERLKDAKKHVLGVPQVGSNAVHRDHDVDDAPAFVWLVSPTGTVTSLSSGAPPSPPTSGLRCRHSSRWGNGFPVPDREVELRLAGRRREHRTDPAGGGRCFSLRLSSAVAVLVVVFGGSLVIGFGRLSANRTGSTTADGVHG